MDKDIKDVLIAVNEVALVVAQNLKGGIAGEFTAFYTKLTADPAFQQKLLTAYQELSLVPAEAKQLTALDTMDLIVTEMGYIPKILTALKG